MSPGGRCATVYVVCIVSVISISICSAVHTAELPQKPLNADWMRKSWRSPWKRRWKSMRINSLYFLQIPGEFRRQVQRLKWFYYYQWNEHKYIYVIFGQGRCSKLKSKSYIRINSKYFLWPENPVNKPGTKYSI